MRIRSIRTCQFWVTTFLVTMAATVNSADLSAQHQTQTVVGDVAVSLVWKDSFESDDVANDTVTIIASIEDAIQAIIPPTNVALESRDIFDELRSAHAAILTILGVDTSEINEITLTVTTLLDNGIMHLFVHNRLPELEAPVAELQSTEFSQDHQKFHQPDLAQLNSSGPPGSARAVVANYDGGSSTASKVRNLLSDTGYSVLSLGTSVEDMRSYTDLGALHLDTHGVAFKRLSRNEDGSLKKGPNAFGIQSSTLAPTQAIDQYMPDLLAGKLIYMNVEESGRRVATKLGITETFIAEYWSFNEGIVLAHVCFGGADSVEAIAATGVDPTPLQQAVLAAGAASFVSFDNYTSTYYAEPSILYFWDHLLGANVYESLEPPARPFDIPMVRAGMAYEGLLEFHKPTNTFAGITYGGNKVGVIFRGAQLQDTLAPSIRNFDMVDDDAKGYGEMNLHGLFGNLQGTVEAAGVQLSISSWTDKEIVAQVPFEGVGSSGQIQVKTPDDVKSNEVPLTEWRGTLTATIEAQGSQKAEAEVDFRFRADVHKYRDSLTETPGHRLVETYINPSSSGSSIGSGSYTDPNDGSVVSWGGEYELRLLSSGEIDQGGISPQSESALGAKIVLEPKFSRAKICVFVSGEVDITATHSSGTSMRTDSVIFGSLPIIANGGESMGLLGCETVGMDQSSFRIDGHQQDFADGEATWTIEWTDLIPISPPDDSTAG